ncbi:MAG: zinc-ribbon domain-containing protein [Syntrophobacteraceae bacterium]
MPLIVITCESCGSQFRLDSERLKKPRNKVRCTKCKHVFEVERPDEDALIYIEVSEEENGFMPGGLDEQPAPAAPPVAGKQKFTARKALLVALPLLLLVALAVYFGTEGSYFTGLQGKAPPKEPPRPTVTIMDTLQAFYLENVHAGQVLVIEGEVLNESSKPVSFVLIEGKLFGGNEKVAQIQRCYSGNTLSRKEISNLKLNEIQDRMMNREGKNLKNVRIPPAAKVPFVLVFHNLPEINSLSNYSIDVISSKFD